MNYPFRSGIIDFLLGGDAARLQDTVETIICNYPPPALNTMMNHIGTHDTERILSVLGGAPLGLNREGQSSVQLGCEQLERGKALLRLAAVLQYTLPGIPSLYYGDEAGSEGLRDPFNRKGYPWGKEDKDLLEFYKNLGKIRQNEAFAGGSFTTLYAKGGVIAYLREKGESKVLIAVNRTDTVQAVEYEGKTYNIAPINWLVQKI